MTVAVGLLLLGTFVLISLNMDSALKRWSRGFGLIVYLDDGISSNEVGTLRDLLQKDPDVTGITYVSQATAIRELRQTLGERSSILDGFEKNPLPASFELKLKSEALDPDRIKQKASKFKKLAGVEDVQYGKKWLASLDRLTKGIKTMVLIFGAVILITIAFVSYSTIKILFYRRKEEIETLKLLGASRTFIRAPFLLEGLFIGLSGGIAGFLGLSSMFYFISAEVIEFMPSIKSVMLFLPSEAYPAAPLAGAVMSLIGSFIAIGKIRY